MPMILHVISAMVAGWMNRHYSQVIGFFFFSSRRRHTRFDCDWSSDVCSSDLEDNADAHLKRQVMGREVVVAITDGKLDFGPWEQIFYAEFDGKRRKRVLVKIIGE